MHDHYRLLGISRDASPQVVKFAFEGKMKALADPAYSAPAGEKREEERLLKEAFVTLSVPAKRGPYDAKLAAFEAGGASPEGERPRWHVPAFAAGCLVLGASALWVNDSREKERMRLEEARLAIQREDATRKADMEAERLRDYKARQEEAIEAARGRNEELRMQRERADYERWRRTEENRDRQAQAAAVSQERRLANEKRMEEDRLRREEEAKRRAALLEVERQKEFLRRQELDEERVRAARHAQAQRESREREYRRYLEEQRRLEQP